MNNKDWIEQLAKELVSVQPMTGPVGQIFNMKTNVLTYKVITDHDVENVPANHHVVIVNHEIDMWINEQPIHMWKFIDEPKTYYDYYIISDELLTWLTVRWA